MKSILLYVSNDEGLESRLQAALDVARRNDAHLTLLQNQPHQDYVAIEMFGGAHLMTDVLAAADVLKAETRQKMEERLANESVKWSWLETSGQTVDTIVDNARFCDLVTMSIAGGEAINRNVSRSIVGEVALTAQRPVLAVPEKQNGMQFDRAMVAYDGGYPAANAIRAALPMLKLAKDVHIAEVEEKDSSFPLTDAAEYLARHDIKCSVDTLPPAGKSIQDLLAQYAADIEADYMVMGAYGQARWRETIFGGVTRHMLTEAKLPLFIAH